MSGLTRDVRHAARRLARTPMFTGATLLTLALGIGANTAIFSLVNSAILEPLPFPGFVPASASRHRGAPGRVVDFLWRPGLQTRLIRQRIHAPGGIAAETGANLVLVVQAGHEASSLFVS